MAPRLSPFSRTSAVTKPRHIWRLGTGEQIDIWEDHWIPGSPSRMVQTPKGQMLLQTISDLIDPATQSWDDVLIRDVFNSIYVERILRILLGEYLFFNIERRTKRQPIHSAQ